MNKFIHTESCVCDFCQSSDQKILYKMPDLRLRKFSQEFSVVECIHCGHRFLSPRPIISELDHLYPARYYAGRGVDIVSQKQRYMRQKNFLPKQPGTILEIGCAGGAWLKSLSGWECYGNDFIKSPFCEDDTDIKHGALTECDFQENFFDVVCAWGVMEHVFEPSKYFQKIHQLLKMKGIFIFMVPNGDSLWSRWAYKEDIPRHVHFFREKILRNYAEKYNFDVERIEYTNSIYSRPATGRGMIKRQFLKRLGLSWQEILDGSNRFRLSGQIASVFDRILIHPRIEELFHICGNMVVVFKKEIPASGL